MTPDGRQGYVLGFMFSPTSASVVLIKKNRPEWQSGRLNGVGGHVEETDDSVHAAMVREFREETGVCTAAEDWYKFATLENEKCIVYVFRSFSEKIRDIRTLTDEEVLKKPVGNYDSRWIPNLSWLIPLALESSTEFVAAKFS